MDNMESIRESLKKIYGSAKAEEAFRKIVPLIEDFPARRSARKGYFNQDDVILITYGDSLNRAGELPLVTLRKFALEHFKDIISTIHILPFFPYSSDDGFSVMDYHSVNPRLGTWKEIRAIGEDFRLMFDLVLNHISAKSEWFANYLADVEGFRDLVIEVDPTTDLSMVTRPRSLPLLTEFKKASGRKVHLWTTFSADQVDLNFSSPDVLARMLEVLLFYIKQGATIIRLDAIAYLWKEIGTNCIHLPQTHEMVKLFRKVLDLVAPDVIILTETNVPHRENMSYFGNGRDEAQMVYNFTLPPLLFYTFVKEDATRLSEWAGTLHLESAENTFLNFTASHDGIGVRPLEGILPPEERNLLIEVVKKNGGRISYKKNPDGSLSPYELNITYVDAMLETKANGEDPFHVQRFLASQAIELVLPGVPAVYIHSLLGSRNWQEGVARTKRARTINRQPLELEGVLAELADPRSFRAKVFSGYRRLLAKRRVQPAFHPNASFEILEADPRVFAIARKCPRQEIYALTNVCSKPVSLSLSKVGIPQGLPDLLTERIAASETLNLEPYQVVWLKQQ